MADSALAYRLFRKQFTPLLLWTIVGTALLLGAVAVLTAPKFALPRRNIDDGASFRVVERLNEQESLRDSEPLFLPTEHNAKEIGLAQELEIAPEEFPGFGRISVLGDSPVGGMEQGDFELPSFATLRDSVLNWGETKTFGEAASEQGIPAGARKRTILQIYDDGGALVGEAELAPIPAGDGRMLPAPVEIECYGEPEERRFVIVQSSGDADFDAATVAEVRKWALRNLRGNGVFSLSVGR